MSNLFFRTNIAPYRIDTYNAFYDKLGCELYFYWDKEYSQNIDMEALKKNCRFKPHILKGFEIVTGKKRRKVCTEVWSIIKSNNPSFVIVPEFQILTIQVLLYKFLHRSKFKVVSMCDDSYDMVVNNNDFSIIHKWARKIVTPMLDDLLLVDSRVVKWYNANYHKGFWFPILRDERIERDRYNRLLPLSCQLAKKYNLFGKKVVLFVGRLVGLKNISRLIEAFALVEDATLVIVGEGDEEKKLKKQCLGSNKEILFIGHLEGDELYAWYNICTVFCLPSYQEAYGAVTNEAFLAGCRGVISEKAGSACLVTHENGELIDPMDVANIASAINRQLRLVSIPVFDALRENMMKISFERMLCNLVNTLNC